MTTAIGYIRVSTDDQAENGYGLAAQRDRIERHCAAEGWELRGVESDEAISGGAGVDKRPRLLRALAALQKGGVLVVAKRDRLARDVVVAAMIERLVEKAGARIASTDGVGNGDGPEAMLLRGIIDVFAQYERLLIGTRTKAALAELGRQGRRRSRYPPWGWSFGDGGKLVKNDAEMQARWKVRAWRSEGFTTKHITIRLNEGGVPPRHGRWNTTKVRALLKGRPE